MPKGHPGLLVVFAQTGSQCTEEEFHDWYSNEHIPLRTATLSHFHTATRFVALDQKEPKWSAIYTISDNEIFEMEAYTKLRANRSPREAGVVGRLAILDRRIYDITSTPSANPTPSSPPPKVVILDSFTPTPSSSPADLLALFDESTTRLATLPGFIRNRMFSKEDVVVSGVESTKEMAGKIGTVFTMTEFDSPLGPSSLSTPEFAPIATWLAAALTPFLDDNSERVTRVFGLYEDFEVTAALKSLEK